MSLFIEGAFKSLHDRQGLTDAQKAIATTRIAEISRFCQNNFEMASAVFAIGSYSRNSICAGERDIDLLAPYDPWGKSSYWDTYKHDSSDFLYKVRDELNDRYHATKVSSRRVCVKLDFTDLLTDVVPAIPRKGEGYLIPDGTGGWMPTNPPYHKEYINDMDKRSSYKLKPVIRLIKAWNIANGHKIGSFHLELMTAQIHSGSTMRAYSVEVEYTLEQLASSIGSECPDPWTSGVRVDRYLTDESRKVVKTLLKKDAERAEAAEDFRKEGKIEKAFELWSAVFNGMFPAIR